MCEFPAAGMPTEGGEYLDERRHYEASEVSVGLCGTSDERRHYSHEASVGASVGGATCTEGHSAFSKVSPAAAGRASGTDAPRKPQHVHDQRENGGAAEDASERNGDTNYFGCGEEKSRAEIIANNTHEARPSTGETVREDHIGEMTHDRKVFKTEYKHEFRPASQFESVHGHLVKRKEDEDEGCFLKRRVDEAAAAGPTEQPTHNPQEPWYVDLTEVRKEAGENKHYNNDEGPRWE